MTASVFGNNEIRMWSNFGQEGVHFHKWSKPSAKSRCGQEFNRNLNKLRVQNRGHVRGWIELASTTTPMTFHDEACGTSSWNFVIAFTIHLDFFRCILNYVHLHATWNPAVHEHIRDYNFHCNFFPEKILEDMPTEHSKKSRIPLKNFSRCKNFILNVIFS